jgi:hypothetical protein
MQYTRSRKKKKKGLINQFCCKFKFNNQFDAILLKIRTETYEAETEFILNFPKFFLLVVNPLIMPESSHFDLIQKGRTEILSIQLMTKVFNFNFFVNRSSTITITFSSYFNLISMLTQQLNQAVPRSYTQTFTQQLMTLSTGVSFQFLGRIIEVIDLYDSAVESGQPTERKTKNLGNIGLDIETDLREFEKNPSRRISEGLEATTSE